MPTKTKDIWTPVEGEMLSCVQEMSNRFNPFAVAIKKDSIVVEHMPRKISAICFLFLRRHGIISYQVTGARKYSEDYFQNNFPCLKIYHIVRDSFHLILYN